MTNVFDKDGNILPNIDVDASGDTEGEEGHMFDGIFGSSMDEEDEDEHMFDGLFGHSN